MKYIELKTHLKDFTVFSLADVRKLDPRFYRRRLNEWQDKGYIKKISKGYYIFSDLKINDNVLFEIANRIYSPSYVSLESALAYYDLIPESVYGITSVSSRRTYGFRTGIGEFAYRTIKRDLFFGYALTPYSSEKNFKMADPDKAVLDYFYLHPDMAGKDDFGSLRFNKEAFAKLIDKAKMKAFLKKFGHNALTKRVLLFLEFMDRA